MRSPELIICPCCGAQTASDLRVEACRACGALAVGPPLARPEEELPAIGLPFAVASSGALLAFVFAASTAFALFGRKGFTLDFWSVVAAAETAAWRSAWAVLPLSLAAAYFGNRAVAHIRRNGPRYAGARLASAGFALSAVVAFAVFTLVGLTVPERLRHRRLAQEAARNAEAYEPIRVLLEYQQQYGSLPASAEDLRKLPDPDGSVARAARMIEAGAYEPESTIASLPPAAARRGGRARNVNVSVRPVSMRPGIDDLPGEGLAFTNYTLRLPGDDGKIGNEDDLLISDGMITRAADAEEAAPRPRTREIKVP